MTRERPRDLELTDTQSRWCVFLG